MTKMVLFFVFLFGTIVGSFLNVVVFRLGTGERIGNARSRCFSCGKTLAWHDMIPLLSFLFQKGKCRYCGSKISIQYPVVEFLSGLIFVCIGWKVFLESGIWNLESGTVFEFIYFAVIFSLLLTISVYDFRHKIIPNQLVYPFIALSLFSGSGTSGNPLPEILAGGAAFLFFASLWFFSHGRWMGFGDAKLALGMGFFLGPLPTFLAVVLSFWIGTLVAVPATLLGGGGLKTQIPFGPFLAAGAFAAWLFNDAILAFSRAFLF